MHVTCPKCGRSGDLRRHTGSGSMKGQTWYTVEHGVKQTVLGFMRIMDSCLLSDKQVKGIQFSPEAQVANVRAALERLRQSRRHRGRAEAIRSAERQLREMEAAHAAGNL